MLGYYVKFEITRFSDISVCVDVCACTNTAIGRLA